MSTKLITEAKNDFENNFLKLMNNSVFVKTVKNIRKYIKYQICNFKQQQKKTI